MIEIQVCTRCGRGQSPQRWVCAQCGERALEMRERTLEGTVYAVSTVHRASGPAFEARVPYVLVLVDLDGGGRRLGHGEPGMEIGERVRSRRIGQLDGASIVGFERVRCASAQSQTSTTACSSPPAQVTRNA